MCETFFNSWRDGELRSYKFAQSQLSQLMRTGEFNCVSSALLYLVCARWFSLDVQGVELPGHVFVQLRTAEGRVIEVETTNKLGFGLVHDRAYFTQEAKAWSKARDLTPATYEDYCKRRIHTPLRTIAGNMINQHTEPARMAPGDRARLCEAMGILCPDDSLPTYSRLSVYVNECADSGRDSAVMLRMFRTIDPYYRALAQSPRMGQPVFARPIAGLTTQYYWALMSNGQFAEAIQLAGFASALHSADTSVSAMLKNISGLTNNRVVTLIGQQHFEEALAFLDSYSAGVSEEQTRAARFSVYENWASALIEANQDSLASEKYRQALPFADSASAQRVRYNEYVLRRRAVNAAWNSGNWSAVVAACSTAMPMALTPGMRDTLRTTLMGAQQNWAVALCKAQEWDNAQVLLDSALSRAATSEQKAECRERLASLYCGWGVFHAQKSEWAAAIQYYRRGREFASSGEVARILATNLQIAQVNSAIATVNAGNLADAQKMIQECAAECGGGGACAEMAARLTKKGQ